MDIDITIETHLNAFIKTFIHPSKRERWQFLFDKNNKKTRQHSAMIWNHLDHELMVRDDEFKTLPSMDIIGVFYHIGDEKRIANLQDLLKEPMYGDRIFSIEAGKLTLFLFHENENYILRKST